MSNVFIREIRLNDNTPRLATIFLFFWRHKKNINFTRYLRTGVKFNEKFYIISFGKLTRNYFINYGTVVERQTYSYVVRRIPFEHESFFLQFVCHASRIISFAVRSIQRILRRGSHTKKI